MMKEQRYLRNDILRHFVRDREIKNGVKYKIFIKVRYVSPSRHTLALTALR